MNLLYIFQCQFAPASYFCKKNTLATAKKIVWAFLKMFVFWMLFFAIQRIVFLCYEYNLLQGVSIISVLSVFWHALRLDISAAMWLMVIPFLIWGLQSVWPRRFFDLAIKIYTGLAIFVFSAITVGEMGVFEEWRIKLHYKALLYLANPSEVVNTAGTGSFILLSGILIALSVLSYFLWWKFFFVRTAKVQRKLIFTAVYTFVIPVLMLVGMRGGTQQIPVNESSCYFSRKDILNLTAINSGWNLMHSVLENRFAMGENPFAIYTQEASGKQVKEILATSCDSTTLVLSSTRPNIVMFILEGWSADLVASLGGDAGITPFTDSLAQDGVLFTQFYNSGMRSQQGISAIISGYPSFPYSTLTQHPEKYRKLPSFVKKIDSLGYETAFTFGGSLDYGNIRSYLNANAFDFIKEQKDINSSIPSGKLGIHDEYMMPVFMGDIDQLNPPFFSALFTVSTHTPYDQEMPEVFTNYQYEGPYVNAAHYSDACLKDFFAKARTKPWYDNTLFIFISDHSHVSYKNTDYFDPEYNRIVCLWYGNVIKPEYRGFRVDKHGSQADFARTMLTQMQVNNTAFKWGKDLLNPCSPDYAYFSYEVGFGWVRPWGVYSADYRVDHPFVLRCDSTTGHQKPMLEIEGKSYLQVLYDDFLGL